MTKLLIYLFPSVWWAGRLSGWFACENMICERIKKEYPNQAKEMLEKLVQ